MCAICGYYSFNNPVEVYDEIKSAMDIMRHRGPDDQGAVAIRRDSDIENVDLRQGFQNKSDGMLGFDRLSIKDLSKEGHQPMISDDGKIALVFNGEIYNDQEIKDNLIRNGYVFRGHSDTEVLLKCYQEYGFDVTAGMLNGMFAFAIADLRDQVIYLARDRFGIKPLYYSVEGGCLSFASELKGILQFRNVKKEIDIDAYNARIVFARPSDTVLIKGVNMLDPGCSLCISFDGNIRKSKFWDIDDYSRNNDKHRNIDEAIDELDSILERAVRRQIISDVPVGCQVSGGIDSTIVSYYANKAGMGLKDGISIIDDTDAGRNEEKYIDIVGEKLDIDVHKEVMNENFFIDNYEYATWCNDAPIYKPYFLSFYLLAKKAKQWVTVLVSGEGSDETTGGYGRFSAGVYYPFLSKHCICSKTLQKYESFAEYEIKSDSTITGFYTKGYDKGDELIDREIEKFNRFVGSNLTMQLKYETMHRLPESCLRQDKMTMAASIENRVPLLDNEVVDFVMELPESYLIRFQDMSPVDIGEDPFRWVEGKYIYKKLLERKFGHDFVYRKKSIMVFDERNVISGASFRNLFYSGILPAMKKRDLIDVSTIESLYENIRSLSKDEFNILWRCIALETWTQLFIDGRDYTCS